MLSETQPVTWIRKTEFLYATVVNGWDISRHLVFKAGRTIKVGEEKYLYVMTKEGHRRVNTGDWQEVRKTIDSETVKTLF